MPESLFEVFVLLIEFSVWQDLSQDTSKRVQNKEQLNENV